jgi:hypothetical protein
MANERPPTRVGKLNAWLNSVFKDPNYNQCPRGELCAGCCHIVSRAIRECLEKNGIAFTLVDYSLPGRTSAAPGSW